jgi:hypothetical protein
MIWQQWLLIGLQIVSGIGRFYYSVEGRPATEPGGAAGGLIFLLLTAGVLYLHIMSGTYTIHNS